MTQNTQPVLVIFLGNKHNLQKQVCAFIFWIKQTRREKYTDLTFIGLRPKCLQQLRLSGKGSRNLIWISHIGGRNSITWAIHLLPPKTCTKRKPESRAELALKPRYSHVEWAKWHFKNCHPLLTTSLSKFFRDIVLGRNLNGSSFMTFQSL